MVIEFRNDRFIDKKTVGPCLSSFTIAGKPFDGMLFNQHLALLATEGIAVLQVEVVNNRWQIVDVRGATPFEMVNFAKAVVGFVSNLGNMSTKQEAITCADRKLKRLEQTLLSRQTSESFLADQIRSERNRLNGLRNNL